jgi:hypothetical protein
MNFGGCMNEPSQTAREIALFATMTDQDCTIRTQKTGGHWYVIAQRTDGEELSFAVRAWNEAQHESATAMRLIARREDNE